MSCDENLQNCLKTTKENKLCNNFYLLLGHGSTRNERIMIPPNFNIVTFSYVNEKFSATLNDMIFLELFARKKNANNDLNSHTHHQLIKFLASPLVGNHVYLNDLEVKLHPPGCEISDINISFQAFGSNTLMKTGIYKMSGSDINKVFIPNSKELFYQDIKMNSSEDLKLRVEDIFSGSDNTFMNHAIHSARGLENLALGKRGFNIEDIFRMYPEGGTFFLPICRSCNEDSMSSDDISLLRSKSERTDNYFSSRLDLILVSSDDENIIIADNFIRIILLSNFRLIESLISNYNKDTKKKILPNLIRITQYNNNFLDKIKENKIFDINRIIMVNSMIISVSIILLNPSEELIMKPLSSYSKKTYEILNLLLPTETIRPEILNLLETPNMGILVEEILEIQEFIKKMPIESK